ncbi:hypothetical protein ACFL47_07765 [Candidatus Latescibacterota bacterium]
MKLLRSWMGSWRLLPVLVLLSSAVSFDASADSTVRILFTNNSNSKLSNCYCRNDSTGGLAERVGFLRTYREKHPDVLLLDSGGYLGLTDIEKKGPAVFKLMRIMEYDAFGIGDQELYRGYARFMTLFGDQTERLINASLIDSDGKPVFTPFRIFDAGEIRVGVVGILSAETFRFFPDKSRDFAFDLPAAILDRLVPEMRKKCDYVVVLSQMGRKEDIALAESREDIDLIIGGHSQTLLEEAITVGKCRIVQAGKGGGRVGEVIVNIDNYRNIKEFEYKLIKIDETFEVPEDIKPIIEQFKTSK